jgi:hypothetical protein
MVFLLCALAILNAPFVLIWLTPAAPASAPAAQKPAAAGAPDIPEADSK